MQYASHTLHIIVLFVHNNRILSWHVAKYKTSDVKDDHKMKPVIEPDESRILLHLCARHQKRTANSLIAYFFDELINTHHISFLWLTCRQNSLTKCTQDWFSFSYIFFFAVRFSTDLQTQEFFFETDIFLLKPSLIMIHSTYVIDCCLCLNCHDLSNIGVTWYPAEACRLLKYWRGTVLTFRLLWRIGLLITDTIQFVNII